jgi:hypothetical protein
MPIWDLDLFPSKGERNAPSDNLMAICNAEEIAHFRQKLRMLQELEYKDWNFKWLKKVRGFYQLREGNFRGYLKIYGKKIVVFHFCRKIKREATEKDIRIAINNATRYEKGSE